jgi:hypothetical protein
MNTKLVRFTFGQEVVCDLVTETEETITIKNSLAGVMTPQGSMAFVPFIPLMDKGKDEVVIDKSHVVYIATPNDLVLEQHRNAFSAVITPEKSLIL